MYPIDPDETQRLVESAEGAALRQNSGGRRDLGAVEHISSQPNQADVYQPTDRNQTEVTLYSSFGRTLRVMPDGSSVLHPLGGLTDRASDLLAGRDAISVRKHRPPVVNPDHGPASSVDPGSIATQSAAIEDPTVAVNATSIATATATSNYSKLTASGNSASWVIGGRRSITLRTIDGYETTTTYYTRTDMTYKPIGTASTAIAPSATHPLTLNTSFQTWSILGGSYTADSDDTYVVPVTYNVELIGPDGAVVSTWAGINANTTLTWNGGTANDAAGTYTWQAVPVAHGGTLSNTFTGVTAVSQAPTITSWAGTSGIVDTDGLWANLGTTDSTTVAPTSASSEITLSVASVVASAPATATVRLLRPDGSVAQTWTNISTGQTLTYSAPGAPSGSWTWQLQASANGASVGGSYPVSLQGTLSWYDPATFSSTAPGQGGFSVAGYFVLAGSTPGAVSTTTSTGTEITLSSPSLTGTAMYDVSGALRSEVLNYADGTNIQYSVDSAGGETVTRTATDTSIQSETHFEGLVATTTIAANGGDPNGTGSAGATTVVSTPQGPYTITTTWTTDPEQAEHTDDVLDGIAEFNEQVGSSFWQGINGDQTGDYVTIIARGLQILNAALSNVPIEKVTITAPNGNVITDERNYQSITFASGKNGDTKTWTQYVNANGLFTRWDYFGGGYTAQQFYDTTNLTETKTVYPDGTIEDQWTGYVDINSKTTWTYPDGSNQTVVVNKDGSIDTTSYDAATGANTTSKYNPVDNTTTSTTTFPSGEVDQKTQYGDGSSYETQTFTSGVVVETTTYTDNSQEVVTNYPNGNKLVQDFDSQHNLTSSQGYDADGNPVNLDQDGNIISGGHDTGGGGGGGGGIGGGGGVGGYIGSEDPYWYAGGSGGGPIPV